MSSTLKFALPALLLLSGCFGGAPDPPRYFKPLQASPAPPGAKPAEGRRLELSSVSAGEHLRDRIVWRKSDVELGFYDLERWTEAPAVYLQRALATELFERRGLRRATRAPQLTLFVELRAFEEVLLPKHTARVRIGASLLDANQTAVWERTFAADRAVKSEDPEAFARAIGAALTRVVDELAGAVEASAAGLPAGDPPG